MILELKRGTELQCGALTLIACVVLIDGHGSESQPRGKLPSARLGGSFETLRGEDSPHSLGWGSDWGDRKFFPAKT